MMKEKMNNKEFKLMQGVMRLIDKVSPHVSRKADSFGIQRGMTVVDYGCGPGRYTVEFARHVSTEGKVYAVDVLEIALQETQKRLKGNRINNVDFKLAKEYDSGIKSKVADIVFAIDMFHHVKNTDAFLKELHRIAKDDGLLVLSGGHQTRSTVKRNIAKSGLWEIANENRKFITYKKIKCTG